MKKLFLILLSAAGIHLQASHFQNSVTVTAQNNDEYLVEMKIENIAAEQPQILAFPVLRCVGNAPAELSVGTEDAGYLVTAQISQTQNEKKLHTSIKLRQNGQIVDTSEHVIKLVN